MTPAELLLCDHDNCTKRCDFQPGDCVFARNFTGQGDRWVAGCIDRQTGPVSFWVALNSSNVVWRRHMDHIQPRMGVVQQEPGLLADSKDGVDVPPSRVTLDDPAPQGLVDTPQPPTAPVDTSPLKELSRNLQVLRNGVIPPAIDIPQCGGTILRGEGSVVTGSMEHVTCNIYIQLEGMPQGSCQSWADRKSTQAEWTLHTRVYYEQEEAMAHYTILSSRTQRGSPG